MRSTIMRTDSRTENNVALQLSHTPTTTATSHIHLPYSGIFDCVHCVVRCVSFVVLLCHRQWLCHVPPRTYQLRSSHLEWWHLMPSHFYEKSRHSTEHRYGFVSNDQLNLYVHWELRIVSARTVNAWPRGRAWRSQDSCDPKTNQKT